MIGGNLNIERLTTGFLDPGFLDPGFSKVLDGVVWREAGRWLVNGGGKHFKWRRMDVGRWLEVNWTTGGNEFFWTQDFWDGTFETYFVG